MRSSLILLPVPLLLAGCDVHSNPATQGGNDVHISMAQSDSGGSGRVSVNVPGFDAKLSLPTFFMKGGHMDIDGLKLAPDTTIRSVDILGHDKDSDKGDDNDNDNVHMTFTNPKAPAELVAYYRQAAGDAGFTVSPISGDGGLIATKEKKKVTVSLTGEGAGSRGAIDVVEGG
ncbi:hypothetical protein FHS31_001923 [Sphingomonas vulcanisoli]|uniref:Uncharacterized protein n=1 Tax=Sphingomonas vulcanisoli TaxID=1658060 RepID=A0ABX0TXE1_9SPHN|nr:hypothetical protein [Sphingomonas vulcanisoli]NIJ08306.1 hypothetical protein [Sphingomonas vulcanisoli]